MSKRTCATAPVALRNIIKERGLDVDALASASGLHKNFFLKWLNGRATLPRKHPAIEKLKEELGVTWQEIVKAKKEHKKELGRSRAPCPSSRPCLHRGKEKETETEKENEIAPDFLGPDLLGPDTCPSDCTWRYRYNGLFRCRLYHIIPQNKVCIFYMTDRLAMPR